MSLLAEVSGSTGGVNLLREIRLALFGDEEAEAPICVKPAHIGAGLAFARIDTGDDMAIYCQVRRLQYLKTINQKLNSHRIAILQSEVQQSLPINLTRL